MKNMKRNIYFLMILTMLLTGCAVPESRIESTEKAPDQIRTEEPADDSVQEKTAPEQDRTLPEASERLRPGDSLFAGRQGRSHGGTG